MIKVAIVGYGNIGKYAVDALRAAPDMELAGIVRRPGSEPVHGIKTASSMEDLGHVDAALLCTPTSSVEETALPLLESYFSHDDTRVQQVPDIDALKDMGHGVLMERKGVSGSTQNQMFTFEMRINNPALTAQVMVACARASMKLASGCYTLPEIAPMDFLPGDREELIAQLV